MAAAGTAREYREGLPKGEGMKSVEEGERRGSQGVNGACDLQSVQPTRARSTRSILSDLYFDHQFPGRICPRVEF
jgi:hypothetical protein